MAADGTKFSRGLVVCQLWGLRPEGKSLSSDNGTLHWGQWKGGDTSSGLVGTSLVEKKVRER